MRTITFWQLLGHSWSSLFCCLSFPHCPGQRSLRSQYQLHFWWTFLYTQNHLPSTPYTVISIIGECVVQVSPSVQFPHVLSSSASVGSQCQEDAGAAALKPAVWPGPAVLFTKAERDLLPHSYTTFCHNSPQTEFPCKANILQPILPSSIFIFTPRLVLLRPRKMIWMMLRIAQLFSCWPAVLDSNLNSSALLSWDGHCCR